MDKLQTSVSSALREPRSIKESKARSMQSMYGAPVHDFISAKCCNGIEVSSRCLKSPTAGQSISRAVDERGTNATTNAHLKTTDARLNISEARRVQNRAHWLRFRCVMWWAAMITLRMSQKSTLRRNVPHKEQHLSSAKGSGSSQMTSNGISNGPRTAAQ